MSRPLPVLLVNLGSPVSPAVPDVRRYLREFLMDRRVIDLPWPLRFCLVHGIIAPFRAPHTAALYQKIWQPEGSPLIVLSRKLQAGLEQQRGGRVYLAMRYQQPSLRDTIKEMARAGAGEAGGGILVPLFPHYAMATFETAVAEAQAAVRALGAKAFPLRVLPPFFDQPDYIAALVAVARPHLDPKPDHLLFSFHGLPERHLRKSDPTGRHCLASPDCCERPSPAHATCYRAQCYRTARAFAAEAGLTPGQWSVAFQSRLGRQPWLQPYTESELARLARAGVKRLAVLCPSFVTDCLETLEEIGLRGREVFLEAGGVKYEAIPCLNDHPAWVQALARMIGR